MDKKIKIKTEPLENVDYYNNNQICGRVLRSKKIKLENSSPYSKVKPEIKKEPMDIKMEDTKIGETSGINKENIKRNKMEVKLKIKDEPLDYDDNLTFGQASESKKIKIEDCPPYCKMKHEIKEEPMNIKMEGAKIGETSGINKRMRKNTASSSSDIVAKSENAASSSYLVAKSENIASSSSDSVGKIKNVASSSSDSVGKRKNTASGSSESSSDSDSENEIVPRFRWTHDQTKRLLHRVGILMFMDLPITYEIIKSFCEKNPDILPGRSEDEQFYSIRNKVYYEQRKMRRYHSALIKEELKEMKLARNTLI